MIAPLLATALAVASADGLSPPAPGISQAGRAVDLVIRPALGSCRLLLSDAETDAPILGAQPWVHAFGSLGKAEEKLAASAGSFEGHYLFDCPPVGSGLVVELAGVSPEVFAVTMPPTPALVAVAGARSSHLWILLLVAGAGLMLLIGRRTARALAVGLLLFAATDAVAHGVDEAAIPVAPGTEIRVPQEIQFALELRTAPVDVGTFAPGGAGASRQYPAVPASAVVERDGKKLVFLRLQPELFVGREVTLGWSNGEQVAIVSGLNPGELAVVSGGAFLRNGGANGP